MWVGEPNPYGVPGIATGVPYGQTAPKRNPVFGGGPNPGGAGGGGIPIMGGTGSGVAIGNPAFGGGPNPQYPGGGGQDIGQPVYRGGSDPGPVQTIPGPVYNPKPEPIPTAPYETDAPPWAPQYSGGPGQLGTPGNIGGGYAYAKYNPGGSQNISPLPYTQPVIGAQPPRQPPQQRPPTIGNVGPAGALPTPAYAPPRLGANRPMQPGNKFGFGPGGPGQVKNPYGGR